MDGALIPRNVSIQSAILVLLLRLAQYAVRRLTAISVRVSRDAFGAMTHELANLTLTILASRLFHVQPTARNRTIVVLATL